MKMKINVLFLVCTKDTNIIQRSNIQTDVVVVNQCDKDCIEEWDFINKQGNNAMQSLLILPNVVISFT